MKLISIASSSDGIQSKTIPRIFLTLLIYLEVLFIFFVDWIPLLGTILALMPLAGKVYIILPHSQGYLKIYGLLEQMELDD